MRTFQKLVVGICLWGMLLPSGGAEAGRRRRSAMMGEGPLSLQTPFDPSMFQLPDGPGIYMDFGNFTAVSGTWDPLLKSGPTAAIGAQWKYAEFSGDMLPPSATYFNVDYRYAFMKGDKDVQLVLPNGSAFDVANMRLNLMEFGVTQRFIGSARRGLFVDVGAGVGLGGANGKINPAAFDPLNTHIFVTKRNEDAILLRGELNGGVGLQLDWVDFRFGVAAGLSSTSALADRSRIQSDIGARLGATIFLWQ